MKPTLATSAKTAWALAASAAVLLVGAAFLLWPDKAESSTSSPKSDTATSIPATSIPALTVTGAYVREPANPNVAAGYFTIRNDGGTGDTLTAVTSDASPNTDLHDERGGTM